VAKGSLRNWVPFIAKLKDYGNGIGLISGAHREAGFFYHVWGGADAILFLKRAGEIRKS
jgi:hypothetical protein